MIPSRTTEEDRRRTLALMREVCNDVIAMRLSGAFTDGSDECLTRIRHKAVKALTHDERDQAGETT